MTKNRSRSLFIVFSIILVVLLVATFVNFTYPFAINGNYYTYSNFVSNMRLGEDIGDSLRIVYRTELPEYEAESNYDNLLESTKLALKDIVTSAGYQDVSVATYGDNGILMSIGNIISKSDSTDIINLVGSPETISFYMEEKSDTATPLAVAKDIKDVSAQEYYNRETGENIYYVRIDFNNNVKDSIAEKTAEGGTLYIYFGDTQFTQMTLGSDGITDGVITIQSDAFTGIDTATYYANKIKSGMLDLQLTQIECANITANYGIGANVLLAIAMTVLVLASFVFLIIKYKHMGWVACFNLLFYITIGLFLLQSIPLVNINLAGIIAMMVAYLVAVDTLMIILEKAKSYYRADTKLYVSFKASQKDNLVRILLNNALFIVAGFICVLLPSAVIKSFGWVMLVSGFVNMFTSLVLMRLFIKMYLPFNNIDGKKCNFHKGGQNA